jgi:hypothetical protein
MSKGLQKKSDSGVIFLAVKHNSLVRESKGPKEGFEEIEVENPRTKEKVKKYIERFSAVEGVVSKIEWYDTEQKYENRYQGWKIHIDANEDQVVLDLPFSSIPASRFMKLAENINWSKPVEFRAWKDAKRDATAFWVGQNNESVPQKYTADNPGDCPPPIQNARGKWNYDAQMDFLFNRMKDVVIPAVQAANAWRTEGKAEAKTKDKPEPDNGIDESTSEDSWDFEELKERAAELVSQTKDYEESNLLADYFGAVSWDEVEKMPLPVLKAVRDKIVDKIVPF